MAVRWRALARARLLRRSGRTDEAIALIDANLAEMPGKADWRRKSALLNERALAEIQVGQGAAARDSLIAASNILVEAGRASTIVYATVIDNLGFVEREAGDLTRASEFHEKAIAVYEKIGAPTILLVRSSTRQSSGRIVDCWEKHELISNARRESFRRAI
jgi:tetratricopeptide (TPR) repeat protein